jgi:putative chromate ion transporter
MTEVEQQGSRTGSPLEVLRIFAKLGFTCFGGPIAHIGYFRDEFVVRRKWVDEHAYADLVGLCQFLPGPASSQVGFSIGLMRAGYLGGLAAWTGFTLPSAIALILFAYGASALSGPLGTGLLHGLKLTAVAIVAQAVWGMARTLCPDRERASIAVVAALGPATQVRQVLCTEYGVGVGIGWHRDKPHFDRIFGLSLGSACKFRFRRTAGKAWDRFTLDAEPRSLYMMSGASRHVWEHSIPAVEAPRYSITFRTMNGPDPWKPA